MYKKRILVISDRDGLDRRSDDVFGLVAGLDRERFEPIFVDLAGGFMARRIEREGISTAGMEVSPEVLALKDGGLFRPAGFTGMYRSLPVTGQLVKMIRERRPGAVYTTSALSHLIGATAGRMAGVSVVWHFRDHVRPPMRFVFTGTALWGPSTIVCNSRYVARQFGLKRKVVIIPDGIDTNMVRTKRRWESVRDVLKVPLDARIVCTVAPDTEVLFKSALLEAAAEVCEKSKNIYFVIAGDFSDNDGADRDSIDTAAAELGIGHRVTTARLQDDRYDIIDACDIYFHTGAETDADVIDALDAMALGKTIIAAPHGAVSEIIRTGESGIFVPHGRPDTLAVTLLELFDNPEVMKALGDNARAAVLERHELKDHVRSIEELLWRLR